MTNINYKIGSLIQVIKNLGLKYRQYYEEKDIEKDIKDTVWTVLADFEMDIMQWIQKNIVGELTKEELKDLIRGSLALVE